MSDLPHNCEFDFDQHDHALTGDRVYETYDELRRCPVAYSSHHGGFWIVTGYDDVKAVESDWETFSSAQGVMFPKFPGQFNSVALEQDPPDHNVFRKHFVNLLSRTNVTAAIPLIEDLTRSSVETLVSRGGGEFMQAVAAKLPVAVISRMLGLSDEVAVQLRDLSEEAWAGYGKAANPAARMIEVLLAEADKRRAEPRDDFLSTIVHADVNGRPIRRDELGNWLQGAALAGHETTMYAAGNLVLDLAVDADLQARVRADVGLIPELVEESLRMRPPVQNFARVLTRDTELHGRSLAEGDRIMVIYGAANRDPDRFPDPNRFDLDREFKNHLTFGWGIHRCAGAYLAQVELRVLAQIILEQPFFRLSGEPQFSHLAGGGTFMGLRSLPIVFTPRDKPPCGTQAETESRAAAGTP
jgi:cytochrome P450